MARILLIDDHVLILDVIQEILKIAGHEVKTASNGAAGIALFKDFDPDVVMLDHDMPYMKGDDIVAQLKFLKNPLRVIVLTGNTNPLVQRRYKILGVTAFLEKSSGWMKIKEAVDSILAEPQWRPGYDTLPEPD